MGLLDNDAASRNALGDRSDLVTLTVKEWLKFFTVGLFPWLAVNGVFAELAVFNRYMPEHKKLSSQAGMACQIANISLVYVYLRRVYRDSFISNRTTVWLLLFLNCVSCVALALFWRVTNGEHSIVILLCTFTGGIVGIKKATSSQPTSALPFWGSQGCVDPSNAPEGCFTQMQQMPKNVFDNTCQAIHCAPDTDLEVLDVVRHPALMCLASFCRAAVHP